MVDNPPLALITGGNGDLACATAREFLSRGWRVLAPGREELDVTDPKSVTRFFSTLDQIDALVHNAGVIRDTLLLHMKKDEWDPVLNVSLRGGFLCAQAAARLMSKRKSGHLLFISSRSARSGPRGQSNYAAAKAGLIGLCQSLAREYGPDNVRSNVILPGYLETKMNRHLSPEIVEAHRKENTLGRFNTVENAARFITFLAELENVSGQVFTLDSRIDRWT